MTRICSIKNLSEKSFKKKNASCEENNPYSFLLDYIGADDKYCCYLVSALENKSPDIYVIFQTEEDDENSKEKICGLFYYACQMLYPWIRDMNADVQNVLELFFEKKKIFCIIGEKNSVEIMEKVFKNADRINPDYENSYHFMECLSNSLCEKKKSFPFIEFRKCRESDESFLFELHKAFVLEEVLPPFQKLNPAAERFSMSRILRKNGIWAAFINGLPVSKANISVLTKNCAQIGGVYTMKQYRKRGISSALIEILVKEIKKSGRKAVLFVKENNSAAIKVYLKTGFKISGSYKSAYYKAL